MLCAVSTFACMDSIAKWLVRDYPVAMVVGSRYVVQMLLMLAFLGPRLGRRLWTSRRTGLQLVRGVTLTASSVVFFHALGRMPLAEASAITFTAPMLVAILAGPILHERVAPRTWLILATGFAGVLFIVRPGTALFSVWALLPLGTAVLMACYQLLTRKLAGVDPALTTLFYPAVVGSILMTVLFPHAYVAPRSVLDATLIGVLGVLGAVGHLFMIRAFESAPVALLAPLVYAQIGGVLLFGYLLFDQFPDGLSLTGMIIIVSSGLWLVLSHRR